MHQIKSVHVWREFTSIASSFIFHIDLFSASSIGYEIKFNVHCDNSVVTDLFRLHLDTKGKTQC